MDDVLFEDVLEVIGVDLDGKVFEKVSRLSCKTEGIEADISLDINIEVYPVKAGDKFSFVIVSKLSENGKEELYYKKNREKGREEDYEYVACGRVFIRDFSEKKLSLSISFGGLLMKIETHSALKELEDGMKVYLMLKKVN